MGLIVSSLSQTIIPYFSGKIIDIISDPTSRQHDLTKIGVEFIFVIITIALFSFMRGFCFNLLGEKVILQLRNDLYQKYAGLLKFHKISHPS